MPIRFYHRPYLLCRLKLWSRFTSSCFVVLQSPELESSLTPQILHRFRAPTNPPPSRWRRQHPSYLVALAVTVFAASCDRFLTLLQIAGGRFGLCNKWVLQSQRTASETIGKNNGTIAKTMGSNGCTTSSNVMNNGRKGCELLIRNRCRLAKPWVEQRLSPAIQR